MFYPPAENGLFVDLWHVLSELFGTLEHTVWNVLFGTLISFMGLGEDLLFLQILSWAQAAPSFPLALGLLALPQ